VTWIGRAREAGATAARTSIAPSPYRSSTNACAASTNSRSAGSWAAVVVEAWCPLAGPAHLAVGHVLPLALLVAAGALLGRRLLHLRVA